MTGSHNLSILYVLIHKIYIQNKKGIPPFLVHIIVFLYNIHITAEYYEHTII